MLAPIRAILDKKDIILASASPRRKELLQSMNINMKICPSTFEENLNPADFKEFTHFMEATALGKAEDVFQRFKAQTTDQGSNLVIIAADTMVTLNGQVYGKPKSNEDAVRMLTNLSGKCNRVYTSVAIRHVHGVYKFTEIADVYFGHLNKEQIQDYVNSGEPLDKAGAYGINGQGGAMISRINGDYYTVMGLPLHRMCTALCEIFGENTYAANTANIE